jgi:excisionase family DNA binding protein
MTQLTQNKFAPRLLTTREAAERLRVSHDTITRMIKRGELPAIRISQRIVRIPVPALVRLESGTPTLRRSVVRRRVTQGVQFGAGEGEPTLANVAR